MKNKLLLSLLAFAVVFTSCSDSSVGPGPQEVKPSSIYVINEGNFSDANGSVTSFKPKSGRVIQQVFQNVNGRPMAGIIQSISAFNGKLYLAVNSANKIEVVDAETFESIATIPLQGTPVDVAPAGGNTIYITNLYGGNVLVMDTETHEVVQKIPVGQNPWEMITVDNLTYVANYGYGEAKTISVINNKKNKVVKTITVGNGPIDLELDKRGRLWVVCKGLIAYDEDFNRVPKKDIPGSIYVINSKTATVINSISLKGHPSDIALNAEKGVGYLLNDGVYLVDLGSVSLMNNKLTARTFNAVGYSASRNMIYLAVSKGYTQPGHIVRFNLQGAAVDSFPAGIAPSGFYFLSSN